MDKYRKGIFRVAVVVYYVVLVFAIIAETGETVTEERIPGFTQIDEYGRSVPAYSTTTVHDNVFDVLEKKPGYLIALIAPPVGAWAWRWVKRGFSDST